MNEVLQTGNTFDNGSFNLGHAKKVWRRIDEQLPGGYMVKNVGDFVSAGLIMSGSPIVKDTTSGADEKDVKILKWSELQAAENVDSLGIIGFLQEDIRITSAYTIATANVIVKGEIYGFMMGDTPAMATANAAKVKTMTQKNGLGIRVVE